MTLRGIISDGRFESDSCALLRKPNFFGDSIEEDEAAPYGGDYKWLCHIGNNMEQMYPLAYLQHMSMCRTMDWELVGPIFEVTLGKIGASEAFTVSNRRDVLGCNLAWLELNNQQERLPNLQPPLSDNS